MYSLSIKRYLVATLILMVGSPVFSESSETKSGDVVNVSVIELKTTSLPVFATLPGVVKSADEVQVASRFMGHVRKINVHEGETVKKGATLLLVDPVDVEGAIGQATAGVAMARAALNDAKQDYERFSNLYAEEAIPKAQFQKYTLAYDVAKAQYDAASSGLKTAQGQLRYTEIKAPVDGQITAKMTDVGQMAAPGRPLLTLQGSGHLQIEVQVDQSTYLPLKLGQEIKLAIEGVNYEPVYLLGKIELKVDAADPMSHTHLVKIGLGDDSLVVPGTYARVFIPVKDQIAITIPARALKIRAGIKGVFIIDDTNRAHFRMVRAGEKRGEQQIILAGLEAGERVVTDTEKNLSNLTKVRLRGDF